jgi:DNA-binding beta-propeller fold protein YncE
MEITNIPRRTMPTASNRSPRPAKTCTESHQATTARVVGTSSRVGRGIVRLLLSLAAGHAALVHAATISTFAGTGTKGFSGDGGLAAAAQLADPNGIARGPDGALYICDTMNHRIRKVTRDGIITTVAGNGEKGFSGDGGPARAAKLNEPYEVRFDRAGNVYWVERLNHLIRKLEVKTGVISTLAGNGTSGFSGDGGLATKAQLNEPHSLSFDRNGDLYIADVRNHRVRKVDMKSGIITTLVGNGKREPTPDGAKLSIETPVAGPRALDFGIDGTLWLALREGNAVYRLDLARGSIHHVAGTGTKGFSGDGGPATSAALNGPKGIAVGPKGDVFVVDTENHAIRVINPRTGTISLVAGNGTRGDGPEGDAMKCAMNRPHGVFVDSDGAVLIGDTETHRVRIVR